MGVGGVRYVPGNGGGFSELAALPGKDILQWTGREIVRLGDNFDSWKFLHRGFSLPDLNALAFSLSGRQKAISGKGES
jgi:hypothetical protein